MGFHLKPHHLLSHPKIFNSNRLLNTYNNNQLIFIIFIVHFSLLFNNTFTYEIPQPLEQSEQLRLQHQQCEPRVLEENPIDPVRSIF